ncbi:MAG: glycosyltransferase family 4 protein [Halobacteriota archaeon]
MTSKNIDGTRLSVNLIYGTYGESGILTSVHNIKKMLQLLESEGVKFYENSFRICDIMHAQTFGPIAFAMALAYKFRRKRVIIHAHTTPDDIKDSYRGSNFLSKCIKGYLSCYYNLADVCIAPSEYTKNVLLKTLNLKTRIVVLSNGIDLSAFSNDPSLAAIFRKRWKLHNDPVILSIGFAFIRKGIIDFIEMAKRLPHYKFVWAGRILDDLFLPQGTQNVIKNAPANVIFTGKIGNIQEALSAADVFVFPSYEENQGIAVLEAAACGLPIVMRALPVYVDYEDDVNCLKFHTIDEFSLAVEKLILDKPKAKMLGRNARLAIEKHDLHVVSRKLLDVYSSAT